VRWFSARLAINLTAVALIGLSLVDVVFVLWLQGQKSRERRFELSAAALEVMAALPSAGARPRPLLARVAGAHRVGISLLDPAGDGLQGAPVPLPQPLPHRQTMMRHGGFEHVVVVLPPSYGWRWLVVSRRLDDALALVLKHHQSALALFVGAAVVMVGVGLLFMRHTVIRPLARLAELVRSGDQVGLNQLGGEQRGPMARLSQAVIGMRQQLDDDRGHIEDQLHALRAAHNELESTGRQLIRAERLAVVGQLAAGVAHEIGNPLTVLSGYAQMLGDPTLRGEDRAAAVGNMQRELDRIHRTIRHLLDYGRAHAEPTAEADLREVLQHVHALLQPQARMERVVLELPQLSQPLPVAIDTDALTQVLLNVLLNAADALAGSGRIRIGVTTTTAAEPAAGAPPAHVIVVIEDSGPGIPAETAERVFEPFFTTKRAGEGTGLGLSVCERIVVSAKGDIAVGASSLGGAKVTLTLPASTARAQ
jgi:signal transduction histidine kinase